ncbi:MAG: YggS family pyridoxal phosphate-dependent enzyme [Acidobacteria bacterium]|nr:YggS family pyridoxal phosphate-dependent enzyme [Acidobacteriota bacterium]
MTTSSLEAAIRSNLQEVRARIAGAAADAGRRPDDVRLIAVSKTFSPAHVRAAAAAGQLDFGENRVQEALDKIGASADLPLHWHLVGHLQSNKARKAVGAFTCIHSVDSVDLLEKLDRAAADQGVRINALLQLNLAGEATKSGAAAPELDRLLEATEKCKAIAVTGLMTLPPFVDNPEDARPFFRQLRQLRDRHRSGSVPLGELSMGMSHDLEVAVQEGATMVRIGTAIFGPRHV